ncbi:MAG: sugar ABC transporter substrate-binding protein [Dysosmobacter sp.]|nr:sugar ABC transporter substrate-binding protein [Dysosmobacter sp.]
MKKFTRFAALCLSVLMLMSLLAGCGSSGGSGSSDGYQIGFVNLADTDVFCMSRETALTAVLEGTEFSVSFTDGNNDNQKQIDQANAFLSKGVDVLILIPADSEAIVPAITAANAKGTPVICLGITAASGDFTYIGSEDFEAGYMQGEYMAANLKENANILYCAGTAGLQNAAARREGFKAALADAGRSDVTILADQDGDYVKDEAMRICDAWIQTYGTGSGTVSFDAIVCANDQMALGCMESLRGAGVLTSAGEVLISGVDGTDDAVKAVAEGYMAQTVLQDAPGQADAVYAAVQKMVAGESVDSRIIVPFQSITAENVADYQ